MQLSHGWVAESVEQWSPAVLRGFKARNIAPALAAQAILDQDSPENVQRICFLQAVPD